MIALLLWISLLAAAALAHECDDQKPLYSQIHHDLKKWYGTRISKEMVDSVIHSLPNSKLKQNAAISNSSTP
jgi:hypothetical protein